MTTMNFGVVEASKAKKSLTMTHLILKVALVLFLLMFRELAVNARLLIQSRCSTAKY